MDNIDYLNQIKENFYNNSNFKNTRDEDNVKLNTFAYIIEPISKKYGNKDMLFDSEHRYFHGGRSDGTIGRLVFEYKESGHFKSSSGIDEALFGRNVNKNDSGLYNYLIDSIDKDSEDIDDSIFNTNGVAFDGYKWIFARFEKSSSTNNIDVRNTRFDDGKEHLYNAEFIYYETDFETGLKNLITLVKSTDRIPLSKDTLTQVFRPGSKYVKKDIFSLYKILENEVSESSVNKNRRVITLYNEWLSTFGAMFGDDEQNSEFNETTDSISKLYNMDKNTIEPKLFLFSLQTYFNIVLKLLISNFLTEARSPVATIKTQMTFSEIASLFEGNDCSNNQIISNFFEVHYYEWFTFANNEDCDDVVSIVNDVLGQLEDFDMGTFKVRPETVHDVLQEVYMNLIPDKVRHLLGEYFSPDWIIELVLNRIGYTEEKLGKNMIDKKLIDPTAGSGAFLLQALKRIIKSHTSNEKPYLTNSEITKITENIVGFDLNPISSISAKANYILTLFSATNVEEIREPLIIPIYITDSVLAPIVYSEENEKTFVAKTSIGEFIIPKFDTFKLANGFMNSLSVAIDKTRSFDVFWLESRNEFNISDSMKGLVKNLYEFLTRLHRSAQDSFWPRIIKNSFAPVLLKQKFDFVVGNPPWISWKSMSKTYRNGTLKIWQSYGIFEKNAYDKKTTHDDFGMAVTYVALDQYLKDQGKLMFLLPQSFLKSTKGGEGFRKFSITRNNQNIPIKVIEVDDFNNIKIFHPKHTVNTIALLLKKGEQTVFPMNNWNSYNYKGKKRIQFNPHDDLNYVNNFFKKELYSAHPIDSKDHQSAWLTMPKNELKVAQGALNNGEQSYYKARKGIEPAGAKGVYIIKKPIVNDDGTIDIVNDMSRQRRKDIKDKGEHPGTIEPTYVYPMLGGRNIQRWKVVSNEYMIVPHDINNIYGLSDVDLYKKAPRTYKWLEFYKEGLLASRIQSGKFFNEKIHPWYRLDNVGTYTYSKYKVLWKEQAKSFAAVAVGSFKDTIPNADLSLLGGIDKPIVTDSKVLLLSTSSFEEALFVTGVLNSPSIRNIIDSYAVSLNRGIDVLKYINVPEFDKNNSLHVGISNCALNIQNEINTLTDDEIYRKEMELNSLVEQLYL